MLTKWMEMVDGTFSFSSLFGERGDMTLVQTLLMLGIVVSLGGLCLPVIDSIGIIYGKTAVTVVEVKQVIPAYSTPIMIDWKTTQMQWHPASYRLHFKIDGEKTSFTVTEKFFADINVGDRIEVDYGLGRLSNSYVPTKIKLVGR